MTQKVSSVITVAITSPVAVISLASGPISCTTALEGITVCFVIPPRRVSFVSQATHRKPVTALSKPALQAEGALNKKIEQRQVLSITLMDDLAEQLDMRIN